MTLAAHLSRIADMVDALSRTPVADLPRAIDAIRMEVHRAERECALMPVAAEPRRALDVRAADIARQVYEAAKRQAGIAP